MQIQKDEEWLFKAMSFHKARPSDRRAAEMIVDSVGQGEPNIQSRQLCNCTNLNRSMFYSSKISVRILRVIDIY